MTLPFFLSFFFFLPVALISSCAGPAATALLIAALLAEATLAPFPDPLSSPAFGRLTVRTAVPFFLLRVIAPKVKSLAGRGGTWGTVRNQQRLDVQPATGWVEEESSRCAIRQIPGVVAVLVPGGSEGAVSGSGTGGMEAEHIASLHREMAGKVFPAVPPGVTLSGPAWPTAL